MSDDRATLTVGGVDYGGWTAVSVHRSIARISGTFEVELTERWPFQPTRRPISPGDACALRIAGETVITGHVDDVLPQFDAAGHAVTISGRDATGDLVDCSVVHAPGEWHGRTITEIAGEICAPFQISVQAQADIGKPFRDFRIEEGETAFESIERMCRHRALLPVSDGLGGLLLARAGANGRAPTPLKRGPGGNIKAASSNASNRDRYSAYTVKGQAAGSDDTLVEDHAQPSAGVEDKGVARYRPLVILAEDQGNGADFKDRAVWERNVRAGRSRQVAVTVQGWRHAGGLWQPNTIVSITDDWLAVDGDLLIEAVAFKLDDTGGTTTELTLVMPAAYDLIALPDPEEEPLW